MGIFTIFSDFFGKNMGNMGILKRLSEVSCRQDAISEKKVAKMFANIVSSENDLTDTN